MTPPVLSSDIKLIVQAIEQLRSCCQVNVQSTWLCSEADLAIADITASKLSVWTPVELNDPGHVACSGGRKVLWLAQKLIVPENLQGYPLAGLCLRLALTWWADSVEVYVNGELAVEGDLFDCSPRVLLSREVMPGEEFVVAVRLTSPGHCDGALMRSLLVYESDNNLDPGFVADELAVLLCFLERFAPDKLDVLAGVVKQITNRQDAKDAEEEGFEKSFLAMRQNLIESKVDNLKFKIYLLGHAHLDLAWLWRVSETWQVAQSTFESVLRLQEDFPELIFCHSTPALYAWVEEYRPDLFAAIKKAVEARRWEILGGFWVEPELNLISGEAIARQLLYGQRYVLEKFGKVSTIVWVPDSFGFCATLPQFLALAGIEFFVTQKLRWNDTTKFDYGAFWWRSPDGSEVFSYMSALIGEGIDPVKMASYACEWQIQTNLEDCLWLPGVGDHGGGPTRDMLETARRFSKSPFFPELEFTTAEKYLQQIKETGGQGDRGTGGLLGDKETGRQGDSLGTRGLLGDNENNSFPLSPSPPPPFPTWNDELYLEFHRGCYTTHADQKRWNRRCEGLLYEAELFAALATIICEATYPKAEIEAAWKKMLFNQFHDILPGSSIPEVYTDALPTWQEVEEVGSKILQNSLSAIASHITLPEPPHPDSLPIFVFNSLNWQRSEVVVVDLPDSFSDACVYNLGGVALPCQLREPSELIFVAEDIPSLGYRIFWLCLANPKNGHSRAHHDDSKMGLQKQEHFYPKSRDAINRVFTLENEFLRVIVDEENGDLSSIFDKVNHREVLSQAGGNQLQAFQDSGQYWDAWNIDPNYAQHPLPPTQLKSIQWLEQGVVQNRLRVVRQIGQSEFCQDYILQAGSPLLKIATTVNWQESQVLVKAAFPLNVKADFATFEIPCGAIRRPTKRETPAEKAKWEVPALRWADLTQEQDKCIYGVSLLNDCKYGYDSQPQQLRLTLLRSPKWPDPEADRGFHEFTYALYPHAGSWESAHTVRRGYELNTPLQVILNPARTANSKLSAAESMSFLNLSAKNLILMAFKQGEDDQQWILRCYECHGETAELTLTSDLKLSLADSVDLLERYLSTAESSSHSIKPWKILSFKVISEF
ncbi:glycosyl hydrolase 38 protein [Tolypothrix sp. NIES-4075]|uniref:alpha-mannosidase n=1 Tax=Tolypothrix sp. NIES-4075 TaxID=2005459 RepID=UPI000B5C472A|nr:alpha-mannosidase [Tolypothrix sp. NIES-4075]GAX43156.1 glycosyl hydrolase 38 protein [Tolypothrix sp. NIES-4075]